MTTHEHEITKPVDLCTPDGTALNPAARGWSRVPLHRANLDGRHGENKRWDYWAILAGDLVVSCVFADVDVIGIADVWWVDLRDGTTGAAGSATSVTARMGASPPQPIGASRGASSSAVATMDSTTENNVIVPSDQLLIERSTFTPTDSGPSCCGRSKKLLAMAITVPWAMVVAPACCTTPAMTSMIS